MDNNEDEAPAMSSRLMLYSTLLLGLLSTPVTHAAGLNPPQVSTDPGGQQAPPVAGGVHAVVVRSWGDDSGGLVWEHPVSIDYTTLHSVDSFTLQDLQATGADVVIVSDPSGGNRQWSPAEVAALATYANQGHNLVGTYLLLQYTTYDNRALAPLWGLRSDLDYTFCVVIDPKGDLGKDDCAPLETSILLPGHCLFTSITNPLDNRFPSDQIPNDGTWDAGDMGGASIVARSADGKNIVTTYETGYYTASFISYMPEYQDESAFEAHQWLYNAIVCQGGSTPVSEATWGLIKSTFQSSGQ
jgi:hypothetical protein